MEPQNWLRIFFYPKQFLELVYRFYAAHGIAYICTYYHLDIENSILDRDILDSGSYEKTAFKHFPDLKELVGILKKEGFEKCGMSGKGPALFGFFQEKVNKKRIKEILGKKSEFIWIK